MNLDHNQIAVQMMKTIAWERFKELCFAADVIEMGDERVMDSEIGDFIVTLETQPSEPDLVAVSEFNETCFPAEVTPDDHVVVKDLAGVECEIQFRQTTLITP